MPIEHNSTGGTCVGSRRHTKCVHHEFMYGNIRLSYEKVVMTAGFLSVIDKFRDVGITKAPWSIMFCVTALLHFRVTVVTNLTVKE